MLKSKVSERARRVAVSAFPTLRSRQAYPVVTDQLPVTLPRSKADSRAESFSDVLVIGAGPTGLACAIECQRLGLKVVVLEKGCLVNSIYNYPANMVFFTTPELLEIGDIPFACANAKPTRRDALEYYRRVAEHYHLHVHQYCWVKTVTGRDNDFRITATDRFGAIHDFRARKIIVSTGYYDLPNMIGAVGEDLPKVFHYYREPYPYYDCDVVVVGGKNSAAEAALDLWRLGARVTLVHRDERIHPNVKYWIRPDLENRIKSGEIRAFFKSTVQEIGLDHIVLRTPGGSTRLVNQFVFALTGYHPDYDFLRSLGLELSDEQFRPFCDPESLETNVPGIYAAGVIVAGSRTSEIFIENGRFHGKQIAADLRQKLWPIEDGRALAD